MNVNFLKDISEAYVIDSGLKIDPNQIFEDLYDIAKFLQSYDDTLYNELYEATTLQQQRILKNYLNITYEQMLINEEFSVVISSTPILLGIVGLIFGKSIAKGVTKTISVVGESLETLGRWLARHGKYFQIRYSIVQENTRKCYAKCGVQKPSDIHVLAYFTIKNTSIFGGQKSIEQGKCLRECYISELIDVIALHMENYFACLRKTNSFDVVQKTDSDDIMKMISSTNVASACESYYTAARDALDNFYRVLELVYDEHSEADKRLEKINALRTKIYEARQIVQRTNENQIQRYSQPQFRTQQNNSNNFRRN